MNITLYQFPKEKELVDKSGDLLSPLLLTDVIFKNGFSILKPVLLISNLGTDTDAYQYNYVYIPYLDRYYFVTDFVVLRENLVELYCEVDPLYTYVNEIKLLEAYVTRNENDYNPTITNSLDVEAAQQVRIWDESNPGLNFTAGSFSFETADIENPGTYFNLVMTVLNEKAGASLYISKDVEPVSSLKLPKVNLTSTCSNIMQYRYLLDETSAILLCNSLYRTGGNSSLATYIKSLIAFPFRIEGARDSNNDLIWERVILDHDGLSYDLGGGVTGDVNAYKPKYYDCPYLKYGTINISISNVDFTWYEPFSEYEIYLPFVGYKKISTEDLFFKPISIYYRVDYTNGMGSCILLANEGLLSEYIVATYTCQMGIKIGISQSNQEANEDAAKTAMITSVISTGVSGLLGLASAVTGNMAGVAGGVLGVTASLTKGINTIGNLHPNATTVINDSNEGYFTPHHVHLRIKNHIITDTSKTAAKRLHGLPLNQTRVLNTLTGYTVVDSVHIEGHSGSKLIRATQTEKDMIERALKAGVIL